MYGGTASPNPSFPQTIHNVSGNNNIKIENINVFTSEWEQGVIDSTTGQNEDNIYNIRTKDFIKVIPEIKYSMSRTISTSFMNVRGYDKNKNYIGAGGNVITTIVGTSNSNPMHTNDTFCVIEPKQNVYYLRFNDQSNNLSTQYMMVQGQYTSETMPSYVAHQEQNLPFSLKSKNLVNPNYIINGSFNSTTIVENNTGYLETNTTKYRTIRIPSLKAGTYTLSINWNYTARIIRKYENGSIADIGVETNTYTFTTSTDGLYAIVFRNTDSSNFADSDYTIQLEQSSTATAYEPYYDIKAMQGTTLQDDGIHQVRGQVVFDGSNDENWETFYSSLQNGKALYRINLTHKQTTAVCNRFQIIPGFTSAYAEGINVQTRDYVQN